MRLYIGKNHEQDAKPVQSIFCLAGKDEDALTYALGFLLAHDPNFCAKLIRMLRVAPRKRLSRNYSIHLQEVTGKGFGRRDIVIKSQKLRVVLEAKVGRAEPTNETDKPSISMISRVLDVEDVKVDDLTKEKCVADKNFNNVPSNEHLEKWGKGLCDISKRAKVESWTPKGKVRLLYLDEPIKFRDKPITKKSYNKTAPKGDKMPNPISKGFSLRFDELLKACSG